MDEREIIINSHKYVISMDENGKATAKNYNEEYKVWVNAIFSNNLESSEKIVQEVKAALKKEYIENILKKY